MVLNEGPRYHLTDAGFLIDYRDWDELIANTIAESVAIELTAAHWEIIYFARNYYEKFQHLPNTRVFVRAIRNELGEEKSSSRYLYRLFPDGPLKSVCKIGGLPKPSSCI